jgi:hypothetical protein
VITAVVALVSRFSTRRCELCGHRLLNPLRVSIHVRCFEVFKSASGDRFVG